MPLARDVATVGSATLASRLLGFVRDLGIAAVLGAGVFSDAFFAVLQIVNFFRRLLAEGALNAAFVPIWLRNTQMDGESGAARFLREVVAAMLLAVGVLAAIGLLLAPAVIALLAPGFDGERQAAAADYLQIAAPYVVLAGVVAVLASVLHAEGRVARGGDGDRGVQCRPAAGRGLDCHLRDAAAGNDRRAARPCHRARRNGAARGDRRRLPAPAHSVCRQRATEHPWAR